MIGPALFRPLLAAWLACLAGLPGQQRLAAAWPAQPGPDPNRPNIVLIYADDLGYGDVQCYNPARGRIPTPHLDRLASQGIRFTDAHSSSAVCSPSRYTLLTGRYHWRTPLQKGIVGLWGPPLIPPDRVTLPAWLKSRGYRTACIGKWHLGWDWPIPADRRDLFRGPGKGPFSATFAHRQSWQETFSQPIPGGPTSRGFDVYFGTDVPNWPPFCFIEQDRTQGIPDEFLPARLLQNHQASVQGPALADWQLEGILPALTTRTCDFISEAARQQQPFFVYLSLTSPHTPLSVNEPWKGKSGLNRYADFVMETDDVVGQVLRSLDRQQVADRTLVIFTSDNGCAPYIGVADLEAAGHFPSGPLRGYKSDAWEGGHRVPLIVRWPGRVASGSVSNRLVHQADVFATCAKILDADLEDSVAEDSFSILPLLNGVDVEVRPHAVSQSIRGLVAIREGPWKLIPGPGSGGWSKGGDDRPGQLYQLGNDLAETNNLYATHPDKVAELTELMQRLVDQGRSNPGSPQRNDRPFAWKRFGESRR
jgi:arylsulfatase A-like enzyme